MNTHLNQLYNNKILLAILVEMQNKNSAINAFIKMICKSKNMNKRLYSKHNQISFIPSVVAVHAK